MFTLLRRPVVLGSVLVVLLAAGGGGYYFLRARGSGDAAPRAAVAVPVQVIPARAGLIRTVLTYSGAIQSSQQVSIAARGAGQLAAVRAEVGQSVRAGDVLASLDPGALPAQVAQGQAAVASAQARLDLLLAGPRAADVGAARAALDAAEAKYAQLLRPTSTDVSAAESALVTAKAAADNAVSTVNNTKATLIGQVYISCTQWGGFGVPCNDIKLPLPQSAVDAVASTLTSGVGQIGFTPGNNAVAMLQANAAYVTALNNQISAQQAYVAAQAKRDALLSPSPSDVAAQRAAVEAARNTLDSKNVTTADIEGARATLAQAQAALATSQASLDQTSIVAPFDGIVAARLLEAGATVTAQAPIFTLLARVLEVHITVDEARLAQIRPGLDVELTVPAYPGKTFKGAVASISPLGDARAHTFDVRIFLEDPTQQLRAGMFTQANVIAASKPNAVLVPNGAITQQGRGSVVFVVVDGKAAQRIVRLGVVDETNSEVLEGVAAGDQVVTVGQNVLRDGQAVQVRAAGSPGGGAPGATPGGGAPGAPTAPAAPSAPGARPTGSPPAGGPSAPRPSGTPSR